MAALCAANNRMQRLIANLDQRSQMCLQELQAEVRRRQAAVLRPEAGSEEERLNAFQRQKRLRSSPS